MSTQVMNKVIADYFKTQPVLKAWLFGSFARGEETPLSDVDLLVVYDENARVSLLKHCAIINDLEDNIKIIECLSYIFLISSISSNSSNGN